MKTSSPEQFICHVVTTNKSVNRSGYIFGDLTCKLVERFSVILAGS